MRELLAGAVMAVFVAFMLVKTIDLFVSDYQSSTTKQEAQK